MSKEAAAKASKVVDLVTMMLSLLHPILILFALSVFALRRWPYACEAVLDAFHVEDISPWMLVVLPGAANLILEGGDGEDEEGEDEEEDDADVKEEGLGVLTRGVVVTPSTNLVERLLAGLHLLFIGHTGGGKTTLMHCVAVMWALKGFKVIVWDPDAAPGLWEGCDVYGGGDEWDEMSASLLVLHNILKTRRGLRKKGVRVFEPLYIVWDEVQDIIKNVNGARDFFEDVARRGRKLNIHIVLGVQDKLVKTLKLEGQSDLRKNFDIVEVFLEGKVRRAHYTEHEGSRTEEYLVPQLQNLDELIVTPPDESMIPPALRATTPTELPELVAPPVKNTPPTQSEFLTTFCYVDPGAKVQAGILFKAYESWCRTQGEVPISQTAFGMRLNDLKYVKRRDSKGNFFYHGIGLLEVNAVGGH